MSKCLSQLTIYKWKESRGECFGFPTYEKVKLVCQGCGRVKSKEVMFMNLYEMEEMDNIN